VKFDLYSQLFEPDRLYIPEERLQKLWIQSLWKKEFLSLEGETIQVLSPGTLNRHEGPDFIDALIFFGSSMREGDVEIHYSNKDWYRHGHHRDPAYDRVILHVIFNRIDHEQWVINRKGEHIPVYLAEYGVLEESPFHPACQPVHKDPETFFRILNEHGFNRLFLKVNYIRRQSARFSADLLAWWGLFQSCGFKANRVSFNRLFLAFPWEDYFTGNLKKSEIPVLMMYLAGFSGDSAEKKFPRLPAPQDLRWVRMGVRPASHPENRLKWLTAFLIRYYGKSLMKDLIKKLFEDRFSRRFWKDFLTSQCPDCREPGEDLAVEIAMNALVPVLMAFMKSTSPGYFTIMQGIRHLSLSEYALSRRFYARHGIESHSFRRRWINQQGILYIHERFCTRDLAELCPLCNEKEME
jgi:hypothetical protein